MPESVCEQLLRARTPERVTRLTEQANPEECLPFLLDKAREALQTAPQEALRIAALARPLAEKSEDSISTAALLRIEGQALRIQGRHPEALLALEAAAAAAQQAGNAHLAAIVQLGRIESFSLLGRHAEAIQLAGRLEAELRILGADADAARALVNGGNAHLRRDAFTPALDCYARAGEVFAESGDTVALAHIQNNQAIILMQLNRVEEAIALYEQAQPLFAAQGMNSSAAKVDSNLGYLHYVSGRYSVAIAAQFRARKEFVALGQAVEAAQSDYDLAETYRALNLHPEALECFERAINVFGEYGIVAERAVSERGRAAVLMALSRTEEAFDALLRAEQHFKTEKNSLQLAHLRLMRAYLLRSQGSHAEAGREAQQAERVLLKAQLPGWAAEAQYLRAEVDAEAGKNVTRQMTAVARTARQHGHRWLECRAERALGLACAEKGAFTSALKHLRAGIEALEEARTRVLQEDLHSSFLRDKLAIYEDAVRTLLERGTSRDVTLALEYVERSKSRLLLERIQSSLESSAAARSSRGESHTKLADLRAALSRSYHNAQSAGTGETRRFGTASNDETGHINELENAYRDALREVEWADSSLPTGHAGASAVVPVAVLQDGLQPDEALIEFYVVEQWVCAFVLTQDKVKVHKRVARVEEVAHALRRWRYQLQKMATTSDYVARHADQLLEGAQSVLCTLYSLLLAPLEPLLTKEKLVVVPHGILHGLPFHAFFNGREYALDRWEFLYAPSAAVWRAGVQRAAVHAEQECGTEALIMGVPDPGIQQVLAEVTQLSHLLPHARVFCGEEATVEEFRAHAGNCRWIHLATHALFRADNPLFSGLRFSNGWLLARDLYELILPCEMATLSACRTGAAIVEPGDELFGLARGFLSAGVRSLALSMWPADDRATAELMAAFYAHLAAGRANAEALRLAQQQTREKAPHPYYWAAFSLMGERRAVHTA